MVEDPRWPAYRESLEALYQARVDALLKPTVASNHLRMVMLAAEARAFKKALGRPAELAGTDPQNDS